MNKPIISAICIIGSVAFITAVLSPKYQKLENTREQVAAKTLDLQNRNNYYQDIAKASEDLKQHAEAISKIDSALPEGFSTPEIYNFFQKTAADSGLVLKQIGEISGEKVSDNARIKENTLALSLTGFYQDFKSFLGVLENSARIIEVEDISFSSPGSEKSPFSFSITVKFYSY